MLGYVHDGVCPGYSGTPNPCLLPTPLSRRSSEEMCTQRIKSQGTLYYWLRLWLLNPKQISGKVGRASHLDSCKEPRSKTSSLYLELKS